MLTICPFAETDKNVSHNPGYWNTVTSQTLWGIAGPARRLRATHKAALV